MEVCSKFDKKILNVISSSQYFSSQWSWLIPSKTIVWRTGGRFDLWPPKYNQPIFTQQLGSVQSLKKTPQRAIEILCSQAGPGWTTGQLHASGVDLPDCGWRGAKSLMSFFISQTNGGWGGCLRRDLSLQFFQGENEDTLTCRRCRDKA